MKLNYGLAIREGFRYLLKEHEDVLTIGQGLWSPWYVGSSMQDLDKEFGQQRVMDTPVCEAATTGVGIGASLCGYRPIVIHPRIDFMILAVDQIVNQAAKWSHMLGGRGGHPAVTIRGIINRGGQQGAQHSQSLHSWFSHVPGLRVVMPATARDARDLLIAATLCDDPVLYMDDRWLYDLTEEMPASADVDLTTLGPQHLAHGKDLTLVGSSFASELCRQANLELNAEGLSADVIDLRVINPLDLSLVYESVGRTGKLLVVDGSWRNCSLGSEIIASVFEKLGPGAFDCAPRRLNLPEAPAPSAVSLETNYYVTVKDVVHAARQFFT